MVRNGIHLDLLTPQLLSFENIGRLLLRVCNALGSREVLLWTSTAKAAPKYPTLALDQAQV